MGERSKEFGTILWQMHNARSSGAEPSATVFQRWLFFRQRQELLECQPLPRGRHAVPPGGPRIYIIASAAAPCTHTWSQTRSQQTRAWPQVAQWMVETRRHEAGDTWRAPPNHRGAIVGMTGLHRRLER